MANLGEIYTKVNSFRARAETRQREYRTNILKAEPGKWGHFLQDSDARDGRNFVVKIAFQSAQYRKSKGKGIADRTFYNMLSSQAMCFNLFAPLQKDKKLASRVLSNFFPDLDTVNELIIEYTPENDIFGDQSTIGGVDCDVLIQGRDRGGISIIIIIETKFVETEFSICGFRKPGRLSKKREVCPTDIPISSSMNKCLYVFKKHYLYWEKSNKYNTLAIDKFPISGCPFAGPLWQLWTNHTLAHAEAAKRGAIKSYFAVCAPSLNKKLLKDGKILEQFRYFLKCPESLVFIDLDEFIKAITMVVASQNPEQRAWINSLAARYADI